MDMRNILWLVMLGLEVVGLGIGLNAFIKAIVHFYFSRKYYKEYLANMSMLVEDMKNDGLYEEDEEVDADRLLFAMKLQLRNSKVEVFKGIIAILIMTIFLLKTLYII